MPAAANEMLKCASLFFFERKNKRDCIRSYAIYYSCALQTAASFTTLSASLLPTAEVTSAHAEPSVQGFLSASDPQTTIRKVALSPQSAETGFHLLISDVSSSCTANYTSKLCYWKRFRRRGSGMRLHDCDSAIGPDSAFSLIRRRDNSTATQIADSNVLISQAKVERMKGERG